MTVSLRNGNTLRAGGMAEWFKAAVLKTVVRKYRGFESYSLRHKINRGEMTELADGARLLSECGGYTPPRVRIPLSPPLPSIISCRIINTPRAGCASPSRSLPSDGGPLPNRFSFVMS